MTNRPVAVTMAIAASGMLALAGCTNDGSTSGPTASASSPSAPRTATRVAPTPTFTATAIASCAAGSTTLTFHRHRTVVDGYQYGLPPDGKVTTPAHLPVIAVVRAEAPGLGTGSGLVSAVGKHWHTMAAALGRTTRHYTGGKVTLHNPSSHRNKADVVYDFVRVYTGQFASVCGGEHVAGHYTTFGDVATVIVACGDTVHGILDRLGHRLCI